MTSGESGDETEEETVQITLTIRKTTVEALETLYPHHLKTQHRIISAVTEVEQNRIQTRALLDHRREAERGDDIDEDLDPLEE